MDINYLNGVLKIYFMNILNVTYFPMGRGGAEVSTLMCAKGLKELGHKVVIASSGKYEGVKTHQFMNCRKWPFELQERYLTNFFKKVIKNERIDVIHSQDRLTSVAAVKAAEQMGIPSVVHFRDYWVVCPKSTLLDQNLKDCDCCGLWKLSKCQPKYRVLFDFYKKFYLRHAKEVINRASLRLTVSSVIKRKLEKRGVKDIEVIHNPRVPLELKEKEGKKVVITFLGNLAYTKGIMFILDVLKDFDVDFWICGKGPLEEEVKDFVDKNQLKNVRLWGWVDYSKMSEIYSESDIVVLPSLWDEPFSGIPLETMFAGKVIVASNKGGSKDIIKNGDNGFILDIDKELWRKTIKEIISSKKLRDGVGKRAKKFAFDNFTVKAISENLECIYKNIIRRYSYKD